MIDVATPALSVLGFFVGLMLWTLLTRWIALLDVASSKEGGDFLGPPKRRLLWAMPLVGLLHPAPWILGAAIHFAARAFRSDTAEGRAWFFGGLSLAVLYMIFNTVVLLSRWRKLRQAESNGPDEPVERRRGR